MFWRLHLIFFIVSVSHSQAESELFDSNRCCGPNDTLKYLSEGKYECSPGIFNEHLFANSAKENENQFGLIELQDVCSSNYKILTNQYDKAFEISLDGNVEIGMKPILHSQYPTKVALSEGEYCRSNVTTISPYQMEVLLYCPNQDIQTIIVNRKVHAGLEFVKAFILTFGGGIYLLLWKYQTVSGWAQVSCFFAYGLHFFFSSAHILMYIDPTIISPSKSCLFMALAYEFTMRATDCTWLVVNIDLARLTWKKNYYKESKIFTTRFIIYMTIGWGLPILCVAADFCRRHFTLEGDEREMNSLGFHEFGYERCLPKFNMLLFASQIAFQVVNFILYITTLVIILNSRRQNKAATKLLDTPGQLYIRLIIFTGTVFLPTKILQKVLQLSMGMIWVWVLTRAYDILLCLYIAKVFAFKKEHMTLLREKYSSWVQAKTRFSSRTTRTISTRNDSRKTHSQTVPADTFMISNI